MRSTVTAAVPRDPHQVKPGHRHQVGKSQADPRHRERNGDQALHESQDHGQGSEKPVKGRPLRSF